MSQSVTLAIGETTVRQINGFFSLNDLHKAAGGAKRHYPSYFLTNQQAKDLISEIGTAGIPVVKTIEGRNGGTYACRELVIAYAAWINAAFHLKVIRVFLGVVDCQTEASATLTPAQKQHLHELVDLIAATGKQSHAETWARLHRKFQVNKYELLRHNQFDEAVAYLRSKMDDQGIGALLQKHFPEALQLPAPTFDPTAALTRGQCALTVELPESLHALVNRKAGEMAGQAYALSREHLLRRIAFKAVRDGQLYEGYAGEVVSSCTLGAALTHEYITRLDTVRSAFQFALAAAQEGLSAATDSIATAQWGNASTT